MVIRYSNQPDIIKLLKTVIKPIEALSGKNITLTYSSNPNMAQILTRSALTSIQIKKLIKEKSSFVTYDKRVPEYRWKPGEIRKYLRLQKKPSPCFLSKILWKIFYVGWYKSV